MNTKPIYVIHQGGIPFEGTGRRTYFNRRNASIALGMLLAKDPEGGYEIVPYIKDPKYSDTLDKK